MRHLHPRHVAIGPARREPVGSFTTRGGELRALPLVTGVVGDMEIYRMSDVRVGDGPRIPSRARQREGERRHWKPGNKAPLDQHRRGEVISGPSGVRPICPAPRRLGSMPRCSRATDVDFDAAARSDRLSPGTPRSPTGRLPSSENTVPVWVSRRFVYITQQHSVGAVIPGPAHLSSADTITQLGVLLRYPLARTSLSHPSS